MTSTNNTVQRQQPKRLTDYLRPVFQEAFMVREYCTFTHLQQSSEATDEQCSTTRGAVNGLYVIPSAQSVYMWFGALFITTPTSPWYGGVIRFVVRFQETYPSTLPVITVLPTTTRPPSIFSTLSTHPDISPSTGQFNLRSYVTSTTSPPQNKTYRILKSFRKAMNRQFYTSPDFDPQSFPNHPAAELAKTNHPEFLTRCAAEASETTKYLDPIDLFLIQKFKADSNLVLLGTNTKTAVNGENRSDHQTSHVRRGVGLSFM